uniref:Uncharacterized protein n=1 Tax=Tanacetum cinerariifolium TaxID=118510 RepID=A0A699UIM4_TANCI|nr:hypothetical protein [Tanacetum cinerariifolium]
MGVVDLLYLIKSLQAFMNHLNWNVTLVNSLIKHSEILFKFSQRTSRIQPLLVKEWGDDPRYNGPEK